MIFDDTKYITPSEGFGIYMSVKLSLASEYDIDKYGLYAKKFTSMFDDPQNARIYFEKLTDKFQTELRLVTHCAANFIIDPSTFVTDLSDDHYLRLRRFNISNARLEKEFVELMEKHDVKAIIKTGKILDLFTSGEISPELFTCICSLFPVDKIFQDSGHAFTWGLLRPRLTAYKNYVTICSDSSALSSCIAKLFKQRN